MLLWFIMVNIRIASFILLSLVVNPKGLAATDVNAWEQLLEHREFDHIISKAKAIRLSDANNQDALYYQAVAMYKSRKREQSTKLFKQLLQHYQPNTISLYRYAMSNYYLGDNSLAIKLLGQMVVQPNSPVSAQIHLGYAYAKIGDYQSAIRTYDNVLKHTQNHSIYYNKALAHFSDGQLVKAVIDMENSIKYKSDFHLPYFGAISLYVILKKPEKALMWLDTLLARKVTELSQLRQDPDLKAFLVSEGYLALMSKYGLQ